MKPLISLQFINVSARKSLTSPPVLLIVGYGRKKKNAKMILKFPLVLHPKPPVQRKLFQNLSCWLQNIMKIRMMCYRYIHFVGYYCVLVCCRISPNQWKENTHIYVSTSITRALHWAEMRVIYLHSPMPHSSKKCK